MITETEAKEFIRQYREVVLDTPYGDVHICGNKERYDELVGQGKLAFSPNELLQLQKATDSGLLPTILKMKTSVPGGKLKDIVPIEKKTETASKQN